MVIESGDHFGVFVLLLHVGDVTNAAAEGQQSQSHHNLVGFGVKLEIKGPKHVACLPGGWEHTLTTVDTQIIEKIMLNPSYIVVPEDTRYGEWALKKFFKTEFYSKSFLSSQSSFGSLRFLVASWK